MAELFFWWFYYCKKEVCHHYAKINEVNIFRYAFKYLLHLHIICWNPLPPTYECAIDVFFAQFSNFPSRVGLERNCFKKVQKYDCRKNKNKTKTINASCCMCSERLCFQAEVTHAFSTLCIPHMQVLYFLKLHSSASSA